MTDEQLLLYNSLSEEGKQAYHFLNTTDMLRQQSEVLNRIERKVSSQNWLTDFASDVAANFTTDGLIWLFRSFKK